MKGKKELSPQFIWSVVAIGISVLIVTGAFSVNSSLAHESESLVQDTVPILFDDWIYAEDIDLITGENRNYIFTPSLNEASNDSSMRLPSTTGVLGSVSVIRTSEAINVYFTMGNSFGTRISEHVAYRFDENNLIGVTAEVHRGDSLALPADKTDSFIKSAVDCEILVIHVPFKSLSFSLKGFSAAYQKLTGG